MTAQTVKEKNKELVTAFYELAINQKKPTDRLVSTSDCLTPNIIRKCRKTGLRALFNLLKGCLKSIPS